VDNLLERWWDASIGLTPPARPTPLGQDPDLPCAIVDCWGVFIASPQNELIGIDGRLGRGGLVARILDASRAGTRNL
jgi:hypothetical protein